MFHDGVGDDIGNDGIKIDGKKTQLKKPETYMEKTVTVDMEMTTMEKAKIESKDGNGQNRNTGVDIMPKVGS